MRFNPLCAAQSFLLRLALVVTAVALAPDAALANGKFPSAGMIVVDPGDPDHLIVQTTFGLLTSTDAGADWRLICEGGIGYQDIEPGVAITANGTLIAGVDDGVRASADGGCDWQLAAGIPAGTAVADVSTDATTPSTAVALAVTAAAQSSVYISVDNAQSWNALGVAIPGTLDGLTLDVAPSDPLRLYVPGFDPNAQTGVVARTSDGGLSWEVFSIPGTDVDRLPFLAAVDPLVADTLYVRLPTVDGALLVSDDGGETWTTIFEPGGFIQGFALSPDGGTLLVGGLTLATAASGIWQATPGVWDFQKISNVGALCMRWAGSVIYACADELEEGFTVGRSLDGGMTFEPLFLKPCLEGILECPAATTVGTVCPAQWPDISVTIGVLDDCTMSSGGASSAAVTAGGLGAAGGAGGAGGATGGGGAGGVGAEDTGDGCGCRAAPPRPANVAWAALLGFVALAVRRRARSV